MTTGDTVTLWINQVKEGERAGVRLLLECYFQRLVQLARSRLLGRPGLAGYEEDVSLSAFKSLCLGAERGRFPQLSDRDDLWRLLAVRTIRKAIDLQRRHRGREAPGETDVEQFLSEEPPPELAAAMADDYQRLLDRLDEDLRALALWKVEGYTNEEIAERLGCVVRTVERKLQRIRILWEEATANVAPNREAAIQTGVDQVCAYTSWPVGHAYVLADDSTGALVPTNIWHFDQPERYEHFRQLTETTRLAPGVGLPGRVLATGQATWIIDVTREVNFPRLAAAIDLGIRAGFGFPVLVGASVVAVLEFFPMAAVEPDEALLQAMAHIGTQLGRVFERQRAEEELRQAKQAAEEANRAKSAFLASMALPF